MDGNISALTTCLPRDAFYFLIVYKKQYAGCLFSLTKVDVICCQRQHCDIFDTCLFTLHFYIGLFMTALQITLKRD